MTGYLNNLSISRSDRTIRLITSKDDADNSSRSNGSSLNLSRLDGSEEQEVLEEKFDHEVIE